MRAYIDGSKGPVHMVEEVQIKDLLREVKGEPFVRLLEVLVESVLLYGVEVWTRGVTDR